MVKRVVTILVAHPDDRRDRKALERMDRECFPADKPFNFQKPRTYWWILWDGRRRAGFIGVELKASCEQIYFCRVGVLEKFRGRGHFSKLLAVALRFAQKLKEMGREIKHARTYTMVDNVPSGRGFTRAGFYYAGCSLDHKLLYWRHDL